MSLELNVPPSFKVVDVPACSINVIDEPAACEVAADANCPRRTVRSLLFTAVTCSISASIKIRSF